MGNGIMPKGGLSHLCPPNPPGKAEEAAKKQKQKPIRIGWRYYQAS